MPANLQDWIGRSETTEDVASPVPLAGLAALLDHVDSPWRAGELPPLAHWLYFLAHHPQSQIDTDGHPRRGGFLPPISLPRRMWAGSRIEFHATIPIGAAMTMRSTIADIRTKVGTSGTMIFVTVKHEIATDGGPAIVEEQDIVYRDAPKRAVTLTKKDAYAERRSQSFAPPIRPDPTLLFRFSALTFNAHRIHYDRDYARTVEGYPGLVVHGPLVATLLMDHFLQLHPQVDVSRFEFRAQSPLFDMDSFDLCADGNELWARGSRGETAMRAKIETR